MSIEHIQQDIEDTIKQAEHLLLTEAKAKADTIIKEAEAKKKKLEASASRQLSTLTTRREQKEKALRESSSQKSTFETQARLLDEVYDTAFEHICSADKHKRKKFLNHLLEQASKEIDVETVHVNKKDKELLETSATIKEADLVGGVICENKDGSMRVDLGFSTLFDQVKKKTLQQVHTTLFNHG